MKIDQTWRVDLARGAAFSDAGVVRFSRVGRIYQITDTDIKSDFKGLRVHLCHQALNAIRISEYEERVRSMSRIPEYSRPNRPEESPPPHQTHQA